MKANQSRVHSPTPRGFQSYKHLRHTSFVTGWKFQSTDHRNSPEASIVHEESYLSVSQLQVRHGYCFNEGNTSKMAHCDTPTLRYCRISVQEAVLCVSSARSGATLRNEVRLSWKWQDGAESGRCHRLECNNSRSPVKGMDALYVRLTSETSI